MLKFLSKGLSYGAAVGLALLLLLLTLPALNAQGTPTTPIPPQYFGMLTATTKSWPTVPFGALRLWDTGTNWFELCSSASNCNFAPLDNWINVANAKGIDDIIYTFGHTPTWASSTPSDATCSGIAGACWAPSDLKSDGTGTDQLWKNYVTAIATHVGSRIQYWEIWNEPYLAKYWKGTNAQMVRMAQDARSIILSVNPNAKILSPSGNPAWLGGFLAAGGGPSIDIFNVHTYPGSNGPEFVLTTLNNEKAAMKQYGQQNKPLWADEGGWGADTNVPNAATQAGQVARFYLLHWTGGAQRFYWYQWSNSVYGTLATSAGPNQSGIAYGQVNNWLVGATMSAPCKASKNTWSCGLSRSAGGYQAEVVWNTSGNASFTAPSQFVQYRDVAGNTHKVSANGVVTIGVSPIILETGLPN